MKIKNLRAKNEKHINIIILVFLLLLFVVFSTYCITQIIFEHQIRVVYSLDKKENDQEIINLIDNADKYIYFAIYTFTKDDIAEALIQAKERGILVWGIMDTEQSNSNNKIILEELRSANIPIETQRHTDGIMHIKTIVTDKAYATGSYNWTESATSHNDETLEMGTNKYLHDKYLGIIEKVLLNNQ